MEVNLVGRVDTARNNFFNNLKMERAKVKPTARIIAMEDGIYAADAFIKNAVNKIVKYAK